MLDVHAVAVILNNLDVDAHGLWSEWIRDGNSEGIRMGDQFITIQTIGERLVIGTVWWESKLQNFLPSDHLVGIRLSADKTPSQVAGEIFRRFLPKYRTVYTAAKAKKQLREQWLQKAHDHAVRIVDASRGLFVLNKPEEITENSTEYTLTKSRDIHEGWHEREFRVSGGSVRILLEGLPVELVEAIVTAMADWYEKKQEKS